MLADYRTFDSSNRSFVQLLERLGVKDKNLNTRFNTKSDTRKCPVCNSKEKYEPKFGHRICANCGYQVFLNPPVSKEYLCPYCGWYERYGGDGGGSICKCCHIDKYPPFKHIKSKDNWTTTDSEFIERVLSFVRNLYKN